MKERLQTYLHFLDDKVHWFIPVFEIEESDKIEVSWTPETLEERRKKVM